MDSTAYSNVSCEIWEVGKRWRERESKRSELHIGSDRTTQGGKSCQRGDENNTLETRTEAVSMTI